MTAQARLPFCTLSAACAMAVVLAGGVVPSSLRAQEQSGPNVNPGGVAAKGAVASYMLAQDLFVLGQANNDALTVLTAARLAGSVRLDAAALQPEPLSKAKAEAQSFASPADVQQIMAAAKTLAAPDERLDPLLLDPDAMDAIGPIAPIKSSASKLAPGQSERWKLAFFGDSHAELAVLGGGGSNLDMLVTDEAGNTICFEAGPSDHAYCDFVPARNGYFTVTVQNSGEAGDAYLLLTN